jgi:non-ribosomal peptide synthase protein (TIGR01720 family)
MMPTTLIRLDHLPLTTNGKLDRQALPPPHHDHGVAHDPPATPKEQLLAGLFAAVLGLPRVGVLDSFFRLGGDSILSLQLVSRARAAGLQLTSQQVFTHQTVRALAATAGEVGDATTDSTDVAVGLVAPTPVMRSWLERGGPLDGYGQSALLQVPADANVDRLSELLQTLLDTHDVLRARLERHGAGGWALRIRPPGSVSARTRLRRVDLTTQDDDAIASSITAESESAFAPLTPESGVMMQAVWFDLGPHRHGRLLFALHHLVVDGVSWRILLADLADAWRTGRLPPSGTSFRRFSRVLSKEASRPGRMAELPLWSRMLSPADPLPLDRPLAAGDTAATLRDLTISLPPDWTEPLLTTVPAAVNGNVNDVLLTALALGVARWRGIAGRSVLVELEGHGREELSGVDLARSVGWFTSAYPIRLDPGIVDRADLEEGCDRLGDALKRIKEQLRGVPDHGLGYGLLRYLNPDTSTLLSELPAPISFNYLGRFAMADPPGTDWAMVADAPPLNGAIHPDTPTVRPLEIVAVAHDARDGPTLRVTFTWPDGVLTEKSVRQLADEWCAALDGLTRYSTRHGIGGVTPSDLTLTSLTQSEIDAFEDELADMLAEEDVR